MKGFDYRIMKPAGCRRWLIVRTFGSYVEASPGWVSWRDTFTTLEGIQTGRTRVSWMRYGVAVDEAAA